MATSMRRKYNYSIRIIICLMISNLVFCLENVGAQLIENFDDGEISSTLWQGDRSSFIVNENKQLQLKAANAGQSRLSAKYKLPTDSILISFWFKMQFAPSGDNNAKIFLIGDRANDDEANGYYITIGENGTTDAIKLWKAEAGLNTQLGSCAMGAMSGDPSEVRLSIKISGAGLWVFSTAYDGELNLQEDLVVLEPLIQLPDSVYFGLSYKYTATRADKFFIDDINISKITPDTKGPELNDLMVIDGNKLKLTFDEALDLSSAVNKSIYNVDNVDNGIGNPLLIDSDANLPSMVTLTFGSGQLKSGIKYNLMISGIKDRFGNTNSVKREFQFTVTPIKGDIIINEVLTDPYIGGEDFVEIYNRSDKSLDLSGLIIANISKNERKTLTGKYILDKNAFLCISKNTDFLITNYKTPSIASFKTDVLPSLNVSDAYIGIEYNGVLLDSFSYSENLHYPLIDETKGVSMERINVDGASNVASNWHSAASSVLFATPGYANSQQRNGNTTSEEFVSLDRKVISPDNDGNDDFVNINFVTEKPGYLASISIFDAEGYKVGDLGQNLSLPAEGFIQWNGINNEGNRMRMGIYIIMVKLFHTDGETKISKHAITVTDTF
jgi:hypothetical protein